MSDVDDKWDRAFSTKRDPKDANWFRAYVDRVRDIDTIGEGIEIFLQDFEDLGLEDIVEELKAFIGQATRRDLEEGVGSAGLCRRAWLDERSIIGETRDQKNPITATQLYQRRQISRVGASNAPNSDRSLTYVKDFDALYFLALAETALLYEVELLRDAIWQHYSRQISLKVTNPYRGYKIFQLEFHLKFFRFSATPANDQGSASRNPPNWTDLSFLATGGKKCGMSEEHFSFVICGVHEGRWAGYAFDDTRSDEEDLQDKIYCGPLHVDPIASCGRNDIIDAERPIWDPREYFLNVVTRRVGSAVDSWEALLRAIERRINEYRKNHPSTLSDVRRDQDETVKTFDWTRKTIELVNALRSTLSETNEQWELFKGPNGDAEYFSDSAMSSSSTDIACTSNYSIPDDGSSHRLKPLLCEIRVHFQKLRKVQRGFDALSASCEDSAKALELRLSLESSGDTQLQVASTDFQIFILLPIAFAAACLQYSPNLMPLPAPQAVVVLTAIFIVAIKMLHVIFRKLPAMGWCCEWIKATVKAMKLQNAGDSLIDRTSSNSGHRRSITIDRTATDVEWGTVPVRH